MSTKTRMKMQCVSKFEQPNGDTQLLLQALYEHGGGNENRAFAEATPSASLSAVISKGKPAAEMFVQGETYYLDIEAVTTVREREGTVAMTTADIKAQADDSLPPGAQAVAASDTPE